ncbi:MAG: TonB-dependent receptor, partial [Porticoccaceae bacterium]|nr:TonB-dependent receptor [Porticoccaceae bacterium]
MNVFPNSYFKILSSFFFLLSFSSTQILAEVTLEEIIVVAEKRNESLQDVSQAITALSGSDLDKKNISSFVGLSAIAPGLTVAKNEGYKTVISIRGVGNETNQNAIAAPSVAFHMDGIFVASPFSLQTDFMDVERIEVLRGPQGTLFGQNSTGGAINVITKAPSVDDFSGKADLTLGSDYDYTKFRATVNIPVSDSVATRIAMSSTKHDGFTENVFNGQDLDDADQLSIRSDWFFDLGGANTLRVFGQYFEAESNGAAIKGFYDTTPGERRLSQNTLSAYELESTILGAIAEFDLSVGVLKVLASSQSDDIYVIRD